VAYVDDINALSPIHYWRLNGNANDTGTGTTLNGGGAGVNFSGTALHPGNTFSAEFDRSSDNIAIASSSDLDNLVKTAFTCSMLVLPTLDTLPFTLFKVGSDSAGIHMFLAAGMVPAVSIVSGGSTTTVFANRPLVINEAANVVYRYDAGTVDIFIDGRNVASDATAPTTVLASGTAGSDIGGDGSTSGTIAIPGGTFTLYTLSARLSDIATWNSLISDQVIFDTLFSGSAVPRSTQAVFTNPPVGTEIRLFDLDNNLAEVGTGTEYNFTEGTVTIDYSVTSEINARLAVINVENDDPFRQIFYGQVVLPREGATFPADLLLIQDRVYIGNFAQTFPPNNVVPPTVAGTPEVGQVISLTNNGTWSGGNLSFSYQWLRSGAPISGATGTSYTLVSADEESSISLRVTATNTAGADSADSNSISLLSTGFVGIFQHTGGAVAAETAAVFDYDTAFRNDGGYYTKSGTSFDLPAGRYLVNATAAYSGSGVNGRGNLVIEARKNSVLIPGSRSSGYQRDTANDAQWCTSTFIIESDGTDLLDFRLFRDANNGIAALQSDRTYLSIVNIDDTTDIGEYGVTSATAFGAQTYSTLALNTAQEVGSNIKRAGNDITLQNGKYLIAGGAFFNGTTARTARFTRFLLDSQHVPGSSSYAYGRDSGNEFMGCNSFAIVEITSGPLTLNFQARGPGPGGVTVDGGASVVGADSQIQVVQLNSGAEFYAGQDATAGQNGAGNPTSVAFNTTVDRSTAGITSGSASAVGANGDGTFFVAGAAMVRRATSNGTRLTREYRILIDGVEAPAAIHGGYNRGDQGDQDVYDSAHHPRGIIEVTDGQAITWSIDKVRDSGWNDGGGTPLTDNSEPVGLYLLDLSTV
jgi:hypothetical protein